jgi:hypothetical protein
MLKDYPEPLDRLQEALSDYVRNPFKLMPFDGATWAPEGRLENFCLEADEEERAAEAAGDADEISRKKLPRRSRCHVHAGSKYGSAMTRFANTSRSTRTHFDERGK